MSLSMKRVIDTLRETGGNVDLYDLGFILTVLRDNSQGLDVQFYLAECLDKLEEVIRHQ